MSLKIFHGKIHASYDPSCRPSTAPRGPITENGLIGTISRVIEGRSSAFIGNTLSEGIDTASAGGGAWALARPAHDSNITPVRVATGLISSL
jgi:hypothetical protein